MSSYLPNFRSRIRWRMRWLALATATTPLLACAGTSAVAQADSGALGAHVASLARKAPTRKSTYIVQFKSGVGEAQARKLVGSHGAHVLRTLPIIQGLAVRMSAHAAQVLGGNYAVKGLTLNGRVKAQASAVNSSKLATSYDEASLATNSWNDGFSGLGVGVAVIDSGIAGNMADFATSPTNPASRVVASVVTNPEATSANDPYGHGTHVAGIIAGNGWNLQGATPLKGQYIGIAPNANLISIKAGNNQGEATVLDVISGLQFAIQHQAELNIRVVNLSLSSETAQSYKLDPLDAAAESAWFHGIVVVAAAGNRASAPDAVSYAPGNDPYVITVGAFDDHGTTGSADDVPASYSSRGVTQDGFSKPEILASGSHIVSTLAPNSAFASMCPECIVGGSYIRASGTSMAAPVISGAVALLLQKYPSLTPNQVKGALLANDKPMPGPYKALTEVATKPTLDHALSASPADQGLTPNAGADTGSTSNTSSTRSSWRTTTWSTAPESLTASWARSSWSCTCSTDTSGGVDDTRSSWRSTWATTLSAE
jgi:serine protease AprX